MSQSNGESSRVFVETGEFQLRGIHVIAKVEISEGRVIKIEFNTDKGNKIEGMENVTRFLLGQPLSKALEVKVEQIVPGKSREEETASSALLEAFHRAIEAYIDEE